MQIANCKNAFNELQNVVIHQNWKCASSKIQQNEIKNHSSCCCGIERHCYCIHCAVQRLVTCVSAPLKYFLSFRHSCCSFCIFGGLNFAGFPGCNLHAHILILLNVLLFEFVFSSLFNFCLQVEISWFSAELFVMTLATHFYDDINDLRCSVGYIVWQHVLRILGIFFWLLGLPWSTRMKNCGVILFESKTKKNMHPLNTWSSS